MLLHNDDPMITFPENDLASANKHNANNAKFEKRVSGLDPKIYIKLSPLEFQLKFSSQLFFQTPSEHLSFI